MKYKQFSTLLICLVLIISFITSPSTGHAQQPYRGVVINNLLDADGIATLKSWKVNLVRYALVWSDTVAADASDATTYAAWLNQSLVEFDPILTALEQNGIKVVLNLHTPPGGFSRRDSKATHRIFQAEWAQDEYVKAWQTISSRYLGRTGIYAYDLLNEPAQQTTPSAPLLNWNDLAQKTAEQIRVIDSSTPLIMTPIYGKLTRLKQMKLLTVSNVMYTIHFYDPWRFIHQGVNGVKLGINYPSKDATKAILNKKLIQLNKFQKKNNTRIFIGEFSVARWAPKGSGARYLKDVISLFEKYKFDWTYHAFREADVWDLEKKDKKSDALRYPTPSGRLKVIQKYLAKNI